MATVQEARLAAVGSVEHVRPPRSLWGDAWYTFTRDKLAVVGLGTIVFLSLAVAIGPFIYPHKIDEIDFNKALLGPSLQHPFGNDDLGRDLLARILWGGRVSIAVGISAVLIAVTLGVAVGALSGYFRRLDNPLMRITDLFLSLPILPLLLVLVYLFRDVLKERFGDQAGIFLMIVGVIGILNWMPTARLVRASFLSLKNKEFVEAARAIGVEDGPIVWRHVLPNIGGDLLVFASLWTASAIRLEASLSFIGLGVPLPTPTWGQMIREGVVHLSVVPLYSLGPGIALLLTVLAFNLVGDGFRDALDPKSRA